MATKFDEAYKQLNDAQRRAVDKIDGPLLVIAGPGTGKTQLLALRTANILNKNPTILAGNILCLTFTDAAAENMRHRLIQYMGQDAYRVGVYTFHSFGAQIMSLYPEYFFKWREVSTADSLTTHRILEEILSDLPGDHDLAGRGIDGSFYAIRQIKNFINDAKSSNLSADDLREAMKTNQKAYDQLIRIIRGDWPVSIAKSGAVDKLAEVVKAFASVKPMDSVISGVAPMQKLIIESMALAAQQSLQLEGRAQTKPFTAWKEKWLAKDEQGQWVFKAQAHEQKILAAIGIYEQYQQLLENRGLADFSDQINWTLAALKQHKDLRLNLQERYQYVMVDEFQDTNRAQLQMAECITEDQSEPNLMAVCDDDQAIFRFQGADIAQIENFTTNHPTTEPVVLSQNYRSNDNIVTAAKKISGQIELSLATSRDLQKPLHTDVKQHGQGTKLYEFNHESQHYSWIANEIKKLLDAKNTGNEIAVLARERAQLDALLPYLRLHSIPINYERRENVLDQPHILNLISLVRLVNHLAKQELEAANQLLPQILSEPMWNLDVTDLWQVARAAHQERKLWFDVIFAQKTGRLREIVGGLSELGLRSAKLPLEQVLDELVGVGPGSTGDEKDDNPEPLGDNPTKSRFVSPFKEYFFSDEIMNGQPVEYLTLLSHLSTLRHQLRNYQQTQARTLGINDLIEFVDAYQRAGLVMLDNAPHREDEQAVQLMTVHKAKGLEFDNVFVIGLNHRIWTKSGGPDRFSYPANLEVIKPSDNQDDDGLRLLFVAMTRARQSLYLTYFLSGEDGKQNEMYSPLLALDIPAESPKVASSAPALVGQYEQRWLKVHGSVSKASMRTMLSEELDTYQLSATHLNNFTDVSIGGPLAFLTQNLLNFPSSIGAYGVYGNAMHSALKLAHEMIIGGDKLDVDKIISDFLIDLAKQPLSDTDKAYFAKKGQLALQAYLKTKASEFKPDQKVEFDFKNQGVTLGDARLKGFIDLMDFNKQTRQILITDYKTGRSYSNWNLPPSADEHERIKLHRYRQQLLFYKLLIDGSNEWGKKGWSADSARLQFVESTNNAAIRDLSLTYESDELRRFRALVVSVWRHIQDLSLPDVSKYPPTLAGILAFEDDLIKERG
ncbi:ATP-dependent helicase [Candidatus Saccharibacteria bacterium]|nr:ATP-dependent helicase [Candidatus Saccharibacteria bacterium]